MRRHHGRRGSCEHNRQGRWCSDCQRLRRIKSAAPALLAALKALLKHDLKGVFGERCDSDVEDAEEAVALAEQK